MSGMTDEEAYAFKKLKDIVESLRIDVEKCQEVANIAKDYAEEHDK